MTAEALEYIGNHQQRLDALDSYQIWDTTSDELYDNVVASALTCCEASAAVLHFMGDHRIYTKAKVGDTDAHRQLLEELSLRTFKAGSLLELAREDDANAFQAAEGIHYYAGTPLEDEEHLILGTLSVIRSGKSPLTQQQRRSLVLLGDQVVQLLKLRKAEANFKFIVDSSKDLIYELDEQGKFVYANNATISKTQYSHQELRNMTCWDLIPKLDRESVRRYFINQAKKGSASCYHEFPILSNDGNRIWLGQNVEMTLRDRRIVRVHVIARDITELVDTRNRLKETEEQILAEKTLLRTMVFSSPAAIAMLGKDLKYLAYSEKWMVNKAVNEQVLGLGEGAIPEERKALLEDLKAKVLSGTIVNSESDLIADSEGRNRWIKWVATPWHNTTDGSIGGMIVYTDDVTEAVQNETEHRKAKEEALASSKIKEEFLSSMSHEIRTPLNAIIGTANLLLDEHPELLDDEKFKLLRFSSNNLLSLINNVLDFSKIESGNIIIEEKDFNIKELCTSLINSWKPTAQRKRLDLVFKFDDRLHEMVKGDKVRLGQILNNLVNNALKFTEVGLVQLSVQSQNGQPGEFYFEVRDTGVGIPKEKQQAVFENFQQVDNDLVLEQGGTGLGLPICRKLLHMMGTDLSLASEKDFGSTFSFALALSEGQQVAKNKATNESAREQLNMTVLLVEDNPANRFIATSFLHKWKVKVSIANNGLEALEQIQSKAFDLVLMDVRMPVMDGTTALKRIREMDDPYFKQVPIIALTASTMMDLRKKPSKTKFNDFLSKPFSPRDLYELLRKYLLLKESKAAVEEHSALKAKMGVSANNVKARLMEYTEGDPTFLVEFSKNIKKNLENLQASLPSQLDSISTEELRELIHMVRPTIEIIGNTELLKRLDQMKEASSLGYAGQNLSKKAHLLIDESLSYLNEILNEFEPTYLHKAV